MCHVQFYNSLNSRNFTLPSHMGAISPNFTTLLFFPLISTYHFSKHLRIPLFTHIQSWYHAHLHPKINIPSHPLTLSSDAHTALCNMSSFPRARSERRLMRLGGQGSLPSTEGETLKVRFGTVTGTCRAGEPRKDRGGFS